MMKKNYLKRMGAWLIIIIGVVGLLAAVGLGARSAFALSSELDNKLNATSVINCIQVGAFKSDVKRSDMKWKSGSGVDVSSFMTERRLIPLYVALDLAKKVDTPKMYGGGVVQGSTATCEGLISQLLKDRGITIPASNAGSERVTEFMENMGYKASGDAGDGKKECVHYDYELYRAVAAMGSVQEYSDGTASTPSVCAKLNPDGTINEITVQDSEKKPLLDYEGTRVDISVNTNGLGMDPVVTVSCYKADNVFWSERKNNSRQPKLNETQWGTTDGNPAEGSFLYWLGSAIRQDCNFTGFSNITGSTSVAYRGRPILTNGVLKPVVEPGTGGEIGYTLQSPEEASKAMTKYLTGESYEKRPKIVNTEKFALYQDYLVNYYEVEARCDWTNDQAEVYGNGDYRKTRLFIGSDLSSGGMRECYVKATKNGDKTVGGVDASSIFGTEACGFDCLTEWLNNNLTVDKPSELPPQPNGVATDGSSDGTSGTTVTTEDGRPIVDCDQFKNIGAMQWVLCPTMNNSQYTANMLDEITEKMLSIDADVYGPGTKTEEAWGIIRNIANVLLVVFFSIVIISQLTGYGIDNYGIKKMLPRIIVMAIIVNLSLYICQIAIDLSNILGVGLRDLFGGIGVEIGGVGGTSFIGGMIAAAFASAGGVEMGIGAGAAMFALGAPIIVGILIAVLVAVLVIIVAIFVLFLMLGVRKIIVIACVILSPLAFAAFILPNTQGMFKKWWDLFKAALIIFPICGFVSGISYLLKTMAMADGTMGKSLGAPGAIVMMILPYAVFFLIPILLKNAIAALGKMGGALTAFGQTVRNGGRQLGRTAWNTAQKTEGFKNLQQDAERARKLRVAKATMERYGDGSDLQRRLAEAQARANADPNSSAARRRLERVQNEQRRFYDAQQSYYQLQGEQSVANTAPGVLATRAASRQEAMELKNYSDQYSPYTSSQLMNELNNAVDAYAADRSDGNRIHLQAAMAEVERRNMMSRVMNNDDNRLTSLGFSANDKNDMILMTQLANSKDLVASQLGKQMAKHDGRADISNISMNSFAQGADNRINLRDAIKGKGSALVGRSDDELEYMSKYGANAATSDALLRAAAATNEEKELTQIHKMFRDVDSNDINLSAEGLATYGRSTMDEFAERAKTDSVFRQKFVDASNQLAKSPELMGKLQGYQHDLINEVRKMADPGDHVFDSTNGNAGPSGNLGQNDRDDNSGLI